MPDVCGLVSGSPGAEVALSAQCVRVMRRKVQGEAEISTRQLS